MTEKRINGAQLKEIRDRLGFSQSRLSAELGVRPDTYNKWEKNKDPVPYQVPAELLEIANQQRLKLDTLLADLDSLLAGLRDEH